MCEAVGLEVARLKRTAIGPLKLGMLAPGKWRELRPGEIGMIRNAIKTSAGTPEVLGDLDEELLGKAAKSRKPRVEQGAFKGKNAGRNDEMTREQSRERGGLRQNQSRSYQPRTNTRGGKPYSKGAGNKPFTKKGSGM